ncbi:MAG: prenyltransferase/squalene oxidase repeat-containing protein, partial [Verrucomicrobiota bacterium]
EARGELTLEESIQRGVNFLIENQNPNGSWGSARQTKGLNIYAPVPGAHDAFRAAVTAMAISALIDSGLANEPGAPADALESGRLYLMENLPKVRRADATAIYNVWTHAFGIQALVDLHPRSDEAGQTEIVALVNHQIERLERYSSIDGGWGYYDFRVGSARPASSSISFTTATCLVALDEASRLDGFLIPEKMIEEAVASINRQRKPDLSYLYGEYLKARPFYGINRPAGSLARSQACNYALRIWGDDTITNQDIHEWLTRLGERNGWLDIGRKRPVPHEAWFAVAGYFFYYGHYYAALSLELLPEKEIDAHQEMLTGILLSLQEEDGSWWDFPFYSYHQPYGTAFALMTLSRCRP